MAKHQRPDNLDPASILSSKPPVDPAPITEDGDTTTQGAIPEDGGLREWLARAKAEDASYTATLYRFGGASNTKQFIVFQWVNELPTAHEVGLEYGPGEYRLLVVIRDGQAAGVKSFRFNIAQEYAEYRRKAGRDGSPLGGATPGNGGGLRESLEVVKLVVETLKPLLEARSAAPQSDPMAAMLPAYEMMGQVMKKNLMENVTLYKEMAQRIADRDDGDVDDNEGEEEAPQQDWTAALMPLLEKYLPVLLGGGVKGRVAVETLKSLPQYRKIVRDETQLAALIRGVEKRYGKAETDKLLQRLKVRRPG